MAENNKYRCGACGDKEDGLDGVRHNGKFICKWCLHDKAVDVTECYECSQVMIQASCYSFVEEAGKTLPLCACCYEDRKLDTQKDEEAHIATNYIKQRASTPNPKQPTMSKREYRAMEFNTTEEDIEFWDAKDHLDFLDAKLDLALGLHRFDWAKEIHEKMQNLRKEYSL